MLIPIIFQRGHSLDQFDWKPWFNLRHQEKTLTASIRRIPDNHYVEVKVDFALLGVPYIRGLFGWADSNSNNAYPTIDLSTLPRARQWLEDGFEVEVVHEAAELLGAMRSMGIRYMIPEQVPDAMEFYQEQLVKLQAQHEHLKNEQQGEFVSPDRYSVFHEALPDLDFETEIADD